MTYKRWVTFIKNALGRGVFPHELSFILDFPLRKLLLSPPKLADRLDLTPAGRVLEVGVGPGFYSSEVARRIPEGRLQLLDLQPEMLKKAKRKLDREALRNIGYTLADAGKLPFKEHSFDVMFLVTVLGEIADQASFLREAHRVLQPGGLLSVTEHLPDPDFSPLPKVRALVEKAGFELSEHFGAKWIYTANFRKV